MCQKALSIQHRFKWNLTGVTSPSHPDALQIFKGAKLSPSRYPWIHFSIVCAVIQPPVVSAQRQLLLEHHLRFMQPIESSQTPPPQIGSVTATDSYFPIDAQISLFNRQCALNCNNWPLEVCAYSLSRGRVIKSIVRQRLVLKMSATR